MKLKRNLAFVFFLLAGSVCGAMLAAATADVAWLRWLSFGQTMGISPEQPLLLDLGILRLSFGCELGLNVAQILALTGALLLYRRIAQKL